MCNMTYESCDSITEPGSWRVEAIDTQSGDCFVTIFYGPDSQQRAAEYAEWKNGSLTSVEKRA